MKTHMKYNCDIRGNWVRVPSDPVTVNRERCTGVHCIERYEKEYKAMNYKPGNLLKIKGEASGKSSAFYFFIKSEMSTSCK